MAGKSYLRSPDVAFFQGDESVVIVSSLIQDSFHFVCELCVWSWFCDMVFCALHCLANILVRKRGLAVLV